MKQIFMAGIATSLLLTTTSFITNVPGVAQNLEKQQALKLLLSAEKQVLTKDQQGKQKVTWQTLKGQATVQPKDILRYTLTGENRSDRPIKNLTLNQPIPQGMVYILQSANFTSNAKITYSIDGARSFVENPTIKVTLANGKVETKPAPASAYTHIRFSTPVLPAKTTLKATYQTQVR
ncbi:DUF11 domain-containing protein [Fortiea sp. LEGE XX443]|uniref:DUF11 domain-containing protein n=1 Tax=Fortiea sp. LEGE XX443 TaxID=1828611 RepID=UPI001880A64A|nr:DUF11 domain-containing protein [Fortiea sp. LEGE XX443]MBE9004185.1 DUF11 domain-containing protein [Fortiea sp. LEGE XX443]